MAGLDKQGVHHFHERLPTEGEVADMLANNERIKRSLEQLRDSVQFSNQSELSCEATKIKWLCEEDQDATIYSNVVKPQNVTENKRPQGVSSF
jgi:hypothetical protein